MTGARATAAALVTVANVVTTVTMLASVTTVTMLASIDSPPDATTDSGTD